MKSAEVKEQVKQFLSSKKNANLLPEILEPLYSKSNVSVQLIPVLRCFKTIFTELHARGEMFHETAAEGQSPEIEYRQWLEARFDEGVDSLFYVVENCESPKLRDLSLETLLHFHTIKNSATKDNIIVKRLIACFLDPESSVADTSGKVVGYLKESLHNRLEFIHLIRHEINQSENSDAEDRTEDWMRNTLQVIKLVLRAEKACKANVEERKLFRKAFTSLWKVIMKWEQMTPSVVRMLVTMLPDYIMDNIDNPVQVCDFLLESFKIGGPLGILSLHGIFILMLNHNLEVPDFYTKLYSLFELPVLHSNYRTRFFRYSNNFLSSTHLPEYLVAAFVKKMARLCLLAPAPCIPLICDFIINLMIRHPGLQILIHNTKADQIVENDPYNVNEPDPAKSNAMESSLWELKTLQNHALVDVAHACSFIEKPLPKVEQDLEEKLSADYGYLLEQEIKKNKNIMQLEERDFTPEDLPLDASFKLLEKAISSSSKKKPRLDELVEDN